MRLYSIHYHEEDGKLRNCRHLKTDNGGCLPPLKRKTKRNLRGEPVCPPRSQQRCTFMLVISAEDRVNIISLGTISRHVFCTPRCYVTKSWEVGVCNTYQVKYLCGGESPSSFDMHILMIMECLQIYLQYHEIRDQTVGYFYLPDDLFVGNWAIKYKGEIPHSCQSLWSLLLSMQLYSRQDDNGMSITAMLAHLNILRHSYFGDLHLDGELRKGTSHRVFLKLLGSIYGKIVGKLRSQNVILRQYYGNCPFQPQVMII